LNATVPAHRVFAALLKRDVRVAQRELPFFLLRTSLQPVLITIVFGYLMPKMGFMSRDFTSAMLPGILAISLAFSSVQSVALPMITDFGFTREIEDRLLAPVSYKLVALEKVLNGVIQGLIAAMFVLPVARLIMGPIDALSLTHIWSLLAVILLSAAAFSTGGLLMGTAVEGQHIGLMFGVIVAPMMMFGCAYYPWSALKVVPVMQYGVLINPLVYVSEGMRAALTPSLPHIPLAAVLSVLALITIFFWTLGIRSFEKRAFS
jgi:ABC-2 type transport system permease protein